MDPDTGTFLNVLEADKRAIRLRFSSDEALRTATSRAQRRRLAHLRKELQGAALRRFVRRAAFRGPVSLEVTIFLRKARALSTRRVVKAYLDMLKGIVYPDDSSVRHLMVDRIDVSDEPDISSSDLGLSIPKPSDVEVFMTVKPLRIYIEQLERAAHYQGEDRGFDLELSLYDSSPWESEQDEDLESPSTLAETAENITTHFSSLSPDQQKEMAFHYQRRSDEARTRLVTSLSFQVNDRPAAPISTSLLPGAHPGEIMLPPPHSKRQQPSWEDELQAALVAHRSNWKVLASPLVPPVGMEIAIPQIAPFKDLDNLAAQVATTVEKVFFDAPGAVTTYRVYVGKATRPELRLRLMDPHQMRALPDAISRVHRRLGGRLP
jgi:hypothetical protein